MFGFGPTRPMPTGPFNDNDTLCGRHVGNRLCARPATWHALQPCPAMPSGLAGSSVCDQHKIGLLPAPLDFHPLEPICLEDHIWWKTSQGTRPGFCYHPEETTSLMEELRDLTQPRQETR